MSKDWALGLFGQERSAPDNYRLIRQVAKGGMSVVYEGRRKSDDVAVAIKVITPEFTQLAEKLDEIFSKSSEGEIAIGMRHPNVVRTLEFGRKGREYFIIMEYIDGLNLKQLIDTNSVRWSQDRFRIAVGAGRGLAYIHKSGLVHRDFCPKNILLAADGTPKIIDFGLAIPEHLKDKWRFDRSGTAAYMAPEQVRGQKVDARTDIYALGVSLYEILTGNRPFPDDHDRQRKMAYHLNVQPTSARQYNRNIPVALEHILMRAMAKAPEDRYPSVEALLREFQTVVGAFFGPDAKLPT